MTECKVDKVSQKVFRIFAIILDILFFGYYYIDQINNSSLSYNNKIQHLVLLLIISIVIAILFYKIPLGDLEIKLENDNITIFQHNKTNKYNIKDILNVKENVIMGKCPTRYLRITMSDNTHYDLYENYIGYSDFRQKIKEIRSV